MFDMTTEAKRIAEELFKEMKEGTIAKIGAEEVRAKIAATRGRPTGEFEAEQFETLVFRKIVGMVR